MSDSTASPIRKKKKITIRVEESQDDPVWRERKAFSYFYFTVNDTKDDKASSICLKEPIIELQHLDNSTRKQLGMTLNTHQKHQITMKRQTYPDQNDGAIIKMPKLNECEKVNIHNKKRIRPICSTSNSYHQQQIEGNLQVLVYPSSEDKDRITLTKLDLKCLENKNLLNDQIIHFYINYTIRQRLAVHQNLLDEIHVFNSFFFSKLKTTYLMQQSYSSVRRWHKDVDLFKKDFLVLPVCERDHWNLIIVCYAYNVFEQNLLDIEKLDSIDTRRSKVKAPVIIVLNSLSGQLPNYTRPIRAFLKHEWLLKRQKNCQAFDRIHLAELWPRLPKQNNDYDCGLYLLQYFECFFKDPRLSYLRIIKRTNLKNWFRDFGVDISKKRAQIKELIEKLSKQSNQSMNSNKNGSA